MNELDNGFPPGGSQEPTKPPPSWIFDLQKRLSGGGQSLPGRGESVVFLVPLFVDNGALWTILGEDLVTDQGDLGRVSFPAAQISAGELAWNAAATLLDEVLGLEPTQGLKIGALDEMKVLGGLHVQPLVVAIPRPEMVGRTLTANTDGGLALFPLEVMSLLEPQSSSRHTVDLPDGPVEVEVTTIDDHALWGPSFEVLERLVVVLSTG